MVSQQVKQEDVKRAKESPPPDNVITLNATPHDYAREWVKRVLSESEIEAPDKARCNGEYGHLNALYAVHKSGGAKAARESFNTLKKNVPELAALVETEQRRHLYREDELPSAPKNWLPAGENIRIPANCIALIPGPSGTGKSYLTTHIALTVAQESPIVYIAAEKFGLYAERRKAWYQHHKLQSKGNAYFYDGAPNLMQPKAVATLNDELRPLKPQAVIIDTLARCMLGGDENSAKDMGLFIEGCETIKRELNCAVIIVHHTGKNGAGERGSSALRGACDCVIELSNEDGVITLTNTKLSSGTESERAYFKLLPVQVGIDPETKEPVENMVLVPSDKTINQPGQKLTGSQQSILDALYQEVFRESGAKYLQLKGYIGGSERTFFRSVSTLMRLGYVVKDGKYDPWRITQAGIDELEAGNG